MALSLLENQNDGQGCLVERNQRRKSSRKINSSRRALREGRLASRTTASKCSRASARSTHNSPPGLAQKPTYGWPLRARAEDLPFTQRRSVLLRRNPSRTTPFAN